MKTMKKILLGMAIMAVSAFGAFSQETELEGNVLGGLDGVFDRAPWEEEASNSEYAYLVADLLVQQMGAGEITEIYMFDDTTDDEEDLEVIENVKNYIKDNYKVKNNQAYSFIVVRSIGEDGVDGYLAFYHYNKKASPKDMYYFYYFCIEF